MQAGDCLQILREIKDVSFASVDEQGNPQVRIIDVMLVEGDKLYFCTSRGKDFHRQLLQHPQIAIEQRVSDGAPAGALDSSVTAGVLDSSYF